MATFMRLLLTGTETHQTVLLAVGASGPSMAAYSPYGYCAFGAAQDWSGCIRFAGELQDRSTGCYSLGNGYRAYHPELMRFGSPDSLSPFGAGGINCYGYCQGDPINGTDPSGHFNLFKLIKWNIPRSRRANISVQKEHFTEQFTRYPDMSDLAFHGDDAMSFSDRGGKRFNLMAHGAPGKIQFMGRVVTGADLPPLLKQNGIDLRRYSTARLIACRSAEEGVASVGQQFASSAGMDVKAYEGLAPSIPERMVRQAQAMTNASERLAFIRDEFFVLKHFKDRSGGKQLVNGREIPNRTRSRKFRP